MSIQEACGVVTFVHAVRSSDRMQWSFQAAVPFPSVLLLSSWACVFWVLPPLCAGVLRTACSMRLPKKAARHGDPIVCRTEQGLSMICLRTTPHASAVKVLCRRKCNCLSKRQRPFRRCSSCRRRCAPLHCGFKDSMLLPNTSNSP